MILTPADLFFLPFTSTNCRFRTYCRAQKTEPFSPDTPGGIIVLNASIASVKGNPAFSVYSATKAAVRSFARTWCVDLKDRGIRVNAISPGVVPTAEYNTSLGMTSEQVDEFVKGSIAGILLGRAGTADEIAKAVSFLASRDSSFVKGIELYVDGRVAQI